MAVTTCDSGRVFEGAEAERGLSRMRLGAEASGCWGSGLGGPGIPGRRVGSPLETRGAEQRLSSREHPCPG